MADIDYTDNFAPFTKTATADGSVQRVLYPKNTRYIYFRIASGSTVAQYKLETPSDSGNADLIDITAGEWYGEAVLSDKHGSGARMDGTNSFLYVKADNSVEIDFAFSVVGGRGG